MARRKIPKNYSLDARGKLHRPDGRFASKSEMMGFIAGFVILIGGVLLVFSAIVATVVLIIWLVISFVALVIRLGTGKSYEPAEVSEALSLATQTEREILQDWAQSGYRRVSDDELAQAETALSAVSKHVDELRSSPFPHARQAWRIHRTREWLARQFDLDRLEWYFGAPLLGLPIAMLGAIGSLALGASFQIMLIVLAVLWTLSTARYSFWMRFADSGGPWAKNGNLGDWVARRQEAIAAQEQIELTALDRVSELRDLRDMQDGYAQIQRRISELKSLQAMGATRTDQTSLASEADSNDPLLERVDTRTVIAVWLSIAIIATAILLKHVQDPWPVIYLVWHFNGPLVLLYAISMPCPRCNARWAFHYQHERKDLWRDRRFKSRMLICRRCGKLVDDPNSN